MELNKKLNETEEELLQLAIIELRQRFESTSKTIYCSHSLENVWEDLSITIPKIGDKKKLIDLSLRNAKYMQLDKQKRKINNIEKQDNKRILEQMQKDLRLINTAQGTLSVLIIPTHKAQTLWQLVWCLKMRRPSKKEYRHFNIKTVVGPDDFASMEEVVYRRYKRLLEEEQPLPELIVVDGGKGQLSSAVKSLDKLKVERESSHYWNCQTLGGNLFSWR